MAVDPILAEGHAALGQAILTRDFDWASAERQVLRAIELNPNYAAPRIWYAFQLAMEGRFTESLREALVARDLDPLAILSRFAVAWCSYHARRFDQALSICRDTLASEPHNFLTLYCSSFVHGRMGYHDQAISHATRLVEVMGKASHTLSTLGIAHARAGNTREAEQNLAEMHAIDKERYISPYHLALLNAALDRTEEALICLNERTRNATPSCCGWALSPSLSRLARASALQRTAAKDESPAVGRACRSRPVRLPPRNRSRYCRSRF